LALTITQENSRYNEQPSQKKENKDQAEEKPLIYNTALHKGMGKPNQFQQALSQARKEKRRKKKRAACVHYSSQKKTSLHQNTKH